MPSRAELDRRIRLTANCGRETKGLLTGADIRQHDSALGQVRESGSQPAAVAGSDPGTAVRAGSRFQVRPSRRPAATTMPPPIAMTIRGSLEWREWVERLAKHCRTDIAKLVDASLILYSKEHGFTEPPPER